MSRTDVPLGRAWSVGGRRLAVADHETDRFLALASPAGEPCHYARCGDSVGYLNWRPYLWLVDLNERVRRVIPAAALDLQRIPEGISELVPIQDSVAVRCGPTWFALNPHLAGPSRPMDDDAITEALSRSMQIDVLAYNREKPRAEWVLPLPGAPLAQLQLPQLRQWGNRATVSGSPATRLAQAGARLLRPSPRKPARRRSLGPSAVGLP